MMKNIYQLLNEYSESHQNKTNKLIHWICVPLIVLSLIGILDLIPFPSEDFLDVDSWAMVVYLFAIGYYFFIAPRLGIAMLVILRLMVGLAVEINHSPELIAGFPKLYFWITLFVLAWIGQFIGHKIEGKKPSFLKDLQFLLIGPLWLLSFIYQKLNIKY
jgi:uncharacterized membrane protein YGL010W